MRPGKSDDLLWKLAQCSRNKNSCRDLATLIHNFGASIDIHVSFTRVTVKKKKPKPHNVDLHWPTLSVRSWCKFIFENHPSLLLGGHDLKNSVVWRSMFESFWYRFRSMSKDHEIYRSGKPWSQCIPIMTHGDEGVSHRRIPFMVQSWQPCCSFLGTHCTAVSGCFGLFRPITCFLYVFSPDSEAMGFLLQITTSCPCALSRQVAGAGAGCRCWCCELAVHAGAVSWLRTWWRQVAGAGCRVPVLALVL